MAVPVISSVQTVFIHSVGQEVFHQLAATNSPTGWRVSGGILPPGLVFNLSSGTISGSCSVVGVWNVFFSAINGDGAGGSVAFLIGFLDLVDAKDVVKRVIINTDTWGVSFPDVAEQVGSLSRAEGGFRYGDNITFQLLFQNAELGQYVPRLNMARFSVKGLDTEPAFIVSGESNFRKKGTHDGNVYIDNFSINVLLESSRLYSFLSDYESDLGTSANVICEFEFLFQRSAMAGLGVDRITTKPFFMRASRGTLHSA